MNDQRKTVLPIFALLAIIVCSQQRIHNKTQCLRIFNNVCVRIASNAACKQTQTDKQTRKNKHTQTRTKHIHRKTNMLTYIYIYIHTRQHTHTYAHKCK